MHKEESAYYEEPFKKLPERIIKSQDSEVDVVSNATNTSRRFLKAVENAIVEAMK